MALNDINVLPACHYGWLASVAKSIKAQSIKDDRLLKPLVQFATAASQNEFVTRLPQTNSVTVLTC